jgi:hypothetical protein
MQISQTAPPHLQCGVFAFLVELSIFWQRKLRLEPDAINPFRLQENEQTSLSMVLVHTSPSPESTKRSSKINKPVELT